MYELASWILFAVCLVAWRYWVGVRNRIVPNWKQIVHASTADGVRLALYRTPPASSDAHGEPVLLVHGLGSNHFNWDLPHPASFPRVLSEHGYDCYVLDLRGRLGSGHPPSGKWRFGFDDYARYDVPSAVDEVLRTSGRNRLHWVGHSMGGMLFYAYAGQFGSDKIASAVTIGSPTIFHPAQLFNRWLLRNRSFFEIFRALPLRVLSQWTAPLTRLLPRALSDFELNVANMDPRWTERAAFHGVTNVSLSVLLDFNQWIVTRKFTSRDKTVDYANDMGKISVPTLLIGGSADRLVGMKNIRIAHGLLGSSEKRIFEAGRVNGCMHDYGHVDLVMGTRAGEEIFPHVAQWLDAHREKRGT